MNASPSPWKLQDSKASLTLGDLDCRLDSSHPFAGMSATIAGATLRLFRVELSAASQQPTDQSPECYVRGCDLVCTYLDDDERKIRGQVYWRALEWGPTRAPGVDLIVSVQTSLLDSNPTLSVRSSAQASEVLRVKQFDPAATENILKPDPNAHIVTVQGTMPACFLFRLNAAELTYVEMVHPADFVSSCFHETAPGEMEHSTQLFRGPLEKGVILRSRLRGVIVPRAGDVVAAVGCYREFAASEPPLTA